ncbi:Guanine nucleotide-binding protein alpha-2 subunit [Mortierella alpina]|nr:Guanine nucleotide-binding protein alpha-2 subunit [Mortierella alpina]
MGLRISTEKERKKQASLAIDRMLDEENRRMKKEIKILLLGDSESGKSTLLQQMKVLHQGGYSTEELATWKYVIYKKLVASAQCLVLAMVKMQRESPGLENSVVANLVLEYCVKSDPSFTLSPEIVDAIDSLYRDPMTAIIMDQPDFKPVDPTLHFMSQVRRIGMDAYTPSVQDILRACMAESLVLFEAVINSRWFLRTSIILMMTKVDVFAAKLPKVPLEKIFTDYTGGPDISKAAKYILWRFTQTNRARLHIYPHMAQDTDTMNFRYE